MENFDFAKGEFKERPPEEITAGERFWRAASDSKLDEVRKPLSGTARGALGEHLRSVDLKGLLVSAIGRGRLGRGVGVGFRILPLLLAPVSSFLTLAKLR